MVGDLRDGHLSNLLVYGQVQEEETLEPVQKPSVPLHTKG